LSKLRRWVFEGFAAVTLAALVLAPVAGCAREPRPDAEDNSGTEQWTTVTLKPGGHFKYTAVVGGFEVWFTYDLVDAGSGRLEIVVRGRLSGEDFSRSVIVTPDAVAASLKDVTDPLTEFVMRPLDPIPYSVILKAYDLQVGSKVDAGNVTVEITGTAVYAGIRGYAGYSKLKKEGDVSTFCVAPNCPLTLYLKFELVEYTLVEASGY
jgi:hypothetical protein